MTDQNRQPAGVPVGGQFAASARPESGVALADQPESLLAEAFRDADLPGTVEARSPDTVIYTDESGHEYRVDFSGGTIGVRAEDVSAYGMLMKFSGQPDFSPEEAVDALRDCQATATDVRAFNAAAAAWLSPAEGLPGHGPGTSATLDDYDGAVSLDDGQVKIHGFTRRDPDLDGPSLRVEVADDDTEPQEFTVHRHRDGEIRYLRGEDWSHPLARWERDALNHQVAGRLNRVGLRLRRLGDLLDDAVTTAEQS